MNKEIELIKKLSKLTYKDEKKELEEIREISQELNWYEFFKYAMYHKTATLCWYNLNRLEVKCNIPKYLYNILRFSFEAIKKQNELYLRECDRVCSILEKENIITIATKGSMLIPKIYKCYGIRFMGDIDLLIKYSDIPRLDVAMKKLGYIQGYYQYSTKNIVPISRVEELKWRMTMSNLFPYVRKNKNVVVPFFELDFRYSLDDTLRKDTVDEIIKKYEKDREYYPPHVLIHLCTHFYDEAKHSVSILQSKDMSIIKLCDIREYFLAYVKEKYIDLFMEFVEKYSFQKQVYFTFLCLENVYNDGYEKEIMSKCNITDKKFINFFGENTNNLNQEFKKNLADRIFSCSNADEIQEKPKFYSEI